jgi:hypothetical protein
MFEVLVYPIPFSLVAGLINYVYFRKQGYSNYTSLYLSVILFYALGVMLTQFLVKNNYL